MVAASPPHLLVIDDDPKLAGVVVAIAREAYPDPHALSVETAHTVEAADVALRRIAASGGIRLVVICDFHLPPSVTHGIQVLEGVRLRMPTAKRVLMTGRNAEELAELLEGAGLDAFVEKPFQLQQMQSLILRLVAEAAQGSATTVPVQDPSARRGGLEAAPPGERS